MRILYPVPRPLKVEFRPSPKYKLVIKRKKGKRVTAAKWIGPRGKGYAGTGKRLARVSWDRQRFSHSA